MQRYRVLTEEHGKVAAWFYTASSYAGALRQFEELHPTSVAVHIERESPASEWFTDGNARKVLEARKAAV